MTENEMREIFSQAKEAQAQEEADRLTKLVSFPLFLFLNWQNSYFSIGKILNKPKILISVTNSRALIGHHSPSSLCTFFDQQCLHIEVWFFSCLSDSRHVHLLILLYFHCILVTFFFSFSPVSPF